MTVYNVSFQILVNLASLSQNFFIVNIRIRVSNRNSVPRNCEELRNCAELFTTVLVLYGLLRNRTELPELPELPELRRIARRLQGPQLLASKTPTCVGIKHLSSIKKWFTLDIQIKRSKLIISKQRFRLGD